MIIGGSCTQTNTFTDLTRESKVNEENNALNKAPELPAASCVWLNVQQKAVQEQSPTETVSYKNRAVCQGCHQDTAGQSCCPGWCPRGQGLHAPAMLHTQHNSQNWVFFLVHASTVKTCRPALKMINLFYQSTVTEKKPSRWSPWRVKCSLSSPITSCCGQWSVHRGHRFRLYTTVRLLTVPVKPHCTNIH